MPCFLSVGIEEGGIGLLFLCFLVVGTAGNIEGIEKRFQRLPFYRTKVRGFDFEVNRPSKKRQPGK
jgi:hypothetical protein